MRGGGGRFESTPMQLSDFASNQPLWQQCYLVIRNKASLQRTEGRGVGLHGAFGDDSCLAGQLSGAGRSTSAVRTTDWGVNITGQPGVRLHSLLPYPFLNFSSSSAAMARLSTLSLALVLVLVLAGSGRSSAARCAALWLFASLKPIAAPAFGPPCIAARSTPGFERLRLPV